MKTNLHIPKSSLDNVILSWWISRPESAPKGNEIDQLHKISCLTMDEREKWLIEILSQDLPIREFVPIFVTIYDAPRAFVDQLDRHRVGFAFWEQSFRVRHLETFADNEDYFMPKNLTEKQKDGEWIYREAMRGIQDVYRMLVEDYGWPRQLARGVIPLHANLDLSFQTNLRAIPLLIAKRACYFAQSDYWTSVVFGILEGLRNSGIPRKVLKTMVKLPCQRENRCPFEKDILDRIVDCSNPVCPILLNRFWRPDAYKTEDEVRAIMEERYPTFREDNKKFLALVGSLLDE